MEIELAQVLAVVGELEIRNRVLAKRVAELEVERNDEAMKDSAIYQHDCNSHFGPECPKPTTEAPSLAEYIAAGRGQPANGTHRSEAFA